MSDTEAKDQEAEVQKKRGRPSKPKPDQSEEPKPKRPRGRPLGSKKKPEEPAKPKRPRGRPRKAAGDVEASASAESTDE